MKFASRGIASLSVAIERPGDLATFGVDLSMADKPPQGNDAKCGFACRTRVMPSRLVTFDYAR